MTEKMNLEEFKQKMGADIGDYVKSKLEAVAIHTTFCRSCNAEIFFLQNVNKKFMPMNLDLTPHWSTCPDAHKFKKPVEKKPIDE